MPDSFSTSHATGMDSIQLCQLTPATSSWWKRFGTFWWHVSGGSSFWSHRMYCPEVIPT